MSIQGVNLMQLEWFVEYYPNDDEGEQWQELTEREFLDLIAQHKTRGIEPIIDYERFTMFDNGRDGRRLTLRDEWGVYYG
jgi:hypothetical protein